MFKGTQFDQIFKNLDEVILDVKTVVPIDAQTIGKVNSLREQVREIGKKRTSIDETIKTIEGKLRLAKEKLEKVSAEVEGAHRERQELLASEADAGKVSLKIRELEDQRAELRDEIAGRDRKLSDLRREIEGLPKREEELKKDAIKTLFVMIGKAMNQEFQKVAEMSARFMKLHRSIPSPQEAQSAAHLSSPDFLIIPRVCFGHEHLEDFFHEQHFMEDVMRESKEFFEKRREETREKLSVQRGLS